MDIGIFGTGHVGKTLAAKLNQGGHRVMIGTRDVQATLARNEPDAMGNLPFAVWQQAHAGVELGTYAQAAAHGEALVNASNGSASLEVLRAAGGANLNGKILLDISNPLDFSHGMPPTLFVSNTDSLGEQIQRTFPGLRVVKTLNTITAHLMANPRDLADGDHHVFVCGNDAQAKAAVTGYLKDWFGWRDVIDLGDITSARGVEMYLPLWLRMWGVVQAPMFNIKLVR